MDVRNFKAPYITKEQIWIKTEEFRKLYWPENTIPVEVEEILWGAGLELEPIPGLKQAGDVDALLSSDMKSIMVDADDYMNERKQNRIRFSIAHELGHFWLHKQLYESLNFKSVSEWIQFIQLIPEDQYSYIEQHAYEFAGRFLVPLERLKSEFQSVLSLARQSGFMEWDMTGDMAKEYIASKINRFFGVSSDVIERRLIRENLWPPKIT